RRSISHSNPHAAASTIATAAQNDHRIVAISIPRCGVCRSLNPLLGSANRKAPCQAQHIPRSLEMISAWAEYIPILTRPARLAINDPGEGRRRDSTVVDRDDGLRPKC